ncbi:MAG TPA: hypothetical protein VGX93_11665 [Chthoniobacterales bacterium]|nr:hypothetical protein [Chthoniobacterales bacterium]
MVVYDLYIYRSGRSSRPFKADPPFVIDADPGLALAVAFQVFKAIAG